jgi:hypothetical protein
LVGGIDSGQRGAETHREQLWRRFCLLSGAPFSSILKACPSAAGIPKVKEKFKRND